MIVTKEASKYCKCWYHLQNFIKNSVIKVFKKQLMSNILEIESNLDLIDVGLIVIFYVYDNLLKKLNSLHCKQLHLQHCKSDLEQSINDVSPFFRVY